MPHLTLEFSANILEKNNMTSLFKECHVMLAHALPSELARCKSRAIESSFYYVGDGQPNNAFVHVSLKVMPGRSFDTLKNVGDNMMKILKDNFSESLKKLHLQITVEISDLQKTYFK
jgi:5-carboxymethyl-2-hydroxymuconate isomerase